MGHVDGVAHAGRTAGGSELNIPTDTRFLTLVRRAQSQGLTAALLMRPILARMPLPMLRYDDPFLPFSKAVIAATRDSVCAYVFDFAAYLALGGAGVVALERAVAFVRAGNDAATILHGPFSTIDYAAAVADTALSVDAITITRTDSTLSTAYAEIGVSTLVVGERLVDGERLSVGDFAAPFRLIGESALYAASGEDFAEATRAAVKADSHV